jgi:hypothetical protein
MRTILTVIFVACTSISPFPVSAQGTTPRSDAPVTQQPPVRDSRASRPGSDAEVLKACVIREQADHTGMSQAEARKNCREQLKSTQPKGPTS